MDILEQIKQLINGESDQDSPKTPVVEPKAVEPTVVPTVETKPVNGESATDKAIAELESMKAIIKALSPDIDVDAELNFVVDGEYRPPAKAAMRTGNERAGGEITKSDEQEKIESMARLKRVVGY